MDGAITEDGERSKEEKEGVDSMIMIIIIIIYLLKSTEQEDAHMINTRTRAGQERHRKLALTFCPLKKTKKTNTLDIKTTTTTRTVKTQRNLHD